MLTDLIIFSWSRTLGTKHTKRNTKLTEKGKNGWKYLQTERIKERNMEMFGRKGKREKKKGKGRIILRLL